MTKETSTSEGLAVVAGDILKTDVLGRITISRAQREAILDAFEASGMTGSTFALHHGIKIQTFASWIQKRRRARGDYQNEAVCRKLRMHKDPPCATRSQKEPRPHDLLPKTWSDLKEKFSVRLATTALENETQEIQRRADYRYPQGG
jgi:hypothetical protein